MTEALTQTILDQIDTSNLDIASLMLLWQSSHWRYIRYYRSSNSNHFGSNWDFEFGHFIANIAITVISLKIYKIYISSNSNYCSSNRDFEFEQFSEIISMSVLSKKIYLISLKLQPKAGVIKMKITQWNIWHIFSPRWTKHFIFGHFIIIVAITVISLKIYKIWH